jgi:anti-sigma regulatory factor (Ser/Thr protein kinase)
MRCFCARVAVSAVGIPDSGYRHEALFYAGADDLLAQVLPFIREGLAAEEPTLVVLDQAKISALRRELAGEAGGAVFIDMSVVGANPARIIPVWQDFVQEHGRDGQRIRGIGEPIWAGRGAAELAECHRHEELLNVAFGDPSFALLCPYDIEGLDAEVIERARETHPLVREGGATTASSSFRGVQAIAGPFDEPLPPPPSDTPVLEFGLPGLAAARSWVAMHAAAVGLRNEQASDLLLAFNEIATNTVVHGRGDGSVRVWSRNGAVVCEIRDAGSMSSPLADRARPAPHATGGRGLWIANQLCDLVQLRTSGIGTVVRLHLRLHTDA